MLSWAFNLFTAKFCFPPLAITWAYGQVKCIAPAVYVKTGPASITLSFKIP